MERSAGGDPAARNLFATTYLPVVRAYLAARWGAGPLRGDIDDAVQEAFVECFRERGALERADRADGRPFRAYLHAVALNVARRIEERRGRDQARRAGDVPSDLPAADARASRAYERRWAETLVRRAAERLEAAARTRGPEAARRVELLRLRFGDGLPIREIARRWAVDPSHLHHEFARAREEFKEALVAEVAWHQPGTEGQAEEECRALLGLLG